MQDSSFFDAHDTASFIRNDSEKPFHLKTDTIEYFRHAEKLLLSPDSEVDRSALISKLFDEIDGKECNLCCHFDTSRCLQRIFMSADGFQLRVFLERVKNKILHLSSDMCASHVLETVFIVCSKYIYHESATRQPSEESAGELPSIEDLVIEVAQEMLTKNNLIECIQQTYSSHFFRTFISVLSGQSFVDLQKGKSAKKYEEQYELSLEFQPYDPPKSFKSALKDISEHLFSQKNAKQLRKLCLNPVSSPCLWSILRASKAKHYLNTILPNCCSSEPVSVEVQRNNQHFISLLATHEIGSRYLEVILEVMPSKYLANFYKTYFKGHLASMVSHQLANFVVQRLIAGIKKYSLLKEVCHELTAEIPNIVQLSRGGILSKITLSQSLLSKGHEKTIDLISKAFHVNDEEHHRRLFPLILGLCVNENYREGVCLYTSIGMAILLPIAQYPTQSAAPIVNSLLTLPISLLVETCCNQYGSRVIEAFLNGPAMTEDDRRKLWARLVDYFTDLAVDKNASHIVDGCWKKSDINLKKAMMSQFVLRKSELTASFFGRIIMKNTRIEEYEIDKKKWETREANLCKKMDLFNNLLGNVAEVRTDTVKDGKKQRLSDMDDRKSKKKKEK